MAANGNDEMQPEVARAVQAGTNLSQGSDKAYDALMAEVTAAQAKYGNDSASFNKFGDAVAQGLKQSGTLEEMSEEFAKHNWDQVATSHDGRMRDANLDPRFGTNALQKAFLESLQTNYGDLQQRVGKAPTRDEFSSKDLQHVLDSRQHERDGVEQARMAQEQTAREQAKLQQVTADLFKNDGNPRDSLYNVLDGIKSGDGRTDGKISRGDLRRFEDDYAVRAARGDFGFNKENLDAVRTLDREWDGPLGLALRGTSPSAIARNSDEHEPNNYINLGAVSQAMGMSAEQLFASNAVPGTRSTMSNVDGSGAPQEGPAPLPPVADNAPVQIAQAAPPAEALAPSPNPQFDARGNPISPSAGAADVPSAPAPISRPVGPGGQPLTAADVPNGEGPQQFDSSGNPVSPSAGAADVPSAPAPISRPVGPGGQPLTAADVPNGEGPQQFDSSGNPVSPSAGAADVPSAPAPISRPVGPGGQPLTAAEAAPGAAPQQFDSSGNPVSPSGHTHRRHPASGEASGAGPADRSTRAVASIDTGVPPLSLPDIKPGDDINKVAVAFEKAAIAHYEAAAIYTVKPGQGWDRVARDTMRLSGEDVSNEAKVEALSDQIAKANGLSGRLDRSKVLHPRDQVRVRDDAWIKAQVDAAMQALLQKVTSDEAKPATPAAPAPEAASGPDPDLFNPQRSGAGDVTDPNAKPVVPEATTVRPAAAPDVGSAAPPPGTPVDANAGQAQASLDATAAAAAKQKAEQEAAAAAAKQKAEQAASAAPAAPAAPAATVASTDDGAVPSIYGVPDMQPPASA